MDIAMPLILVIDDDVAVRGLVCEILLRAGFRVSSAGTADGAYDILATSLEAGEPFDLVVSDVMMWGETGPAMLKRFSVDKGVDFPVLFISGYSKQALVSKGLLGVDQELLEKTSFMLSELITKVRSMLDV